MVARKINQKLLKAHLQALRDGMTYHEAAEHCGVSYHTINTYRNANPEYQDQCDAARDYIIADAEECIRTAIEKGDAKTAMDFLKYNRRARNYGVKQEVEHKGNINYVFRVGVWDNESETGSDTV